jgi:hypothetical protein
MSKVSALPFGAKSRLIFAEGVKVIMSSLEIDMKFAVGSSLHHNFHPENN